MVVNTLMRWKSATADLNYATEWIVEWAHRQARGVRGRPVRMMDIGLGTGRDLLAVRQRCAGIELDLWGCEGQERFVELAKRNGIRTFAVNIETERLPVPDAQFDLVLANHVIEHLKELPWFFAEIARVLVPGGVAIIGCPNLASWHNRVALLFGYQPPCMQVLGPHVRGITRSDFKRFIEHRGFFHLAGWKGSNFYPFAVRWLNRALGAVMPNLCNAIHFAIRRTEKPGSFLEILDSGVPGMTDTPYYRGESAPEAPLPELERVAV